MPRTAFPFFLVLISLLVVPTQQATARYRTPAPLPARRAALITTRSTSLTTVSDTNHRRLLAFVRPAGNGSLALTSATPGKTRCINHYVINKSYYLVDLPGYGYARVARTDREAWQVGTFEPQFDLNIVLTELVTGI